MTSDEANNYVLGHSGRELERLHCQAQLVNPITRQYLIEAGIAFGMRVLDVGSGAGNVAFLSRDSWRGQRIGDAVTVEIDDGVMDGLVERGEVFEGLVGEVMGLKIAPDRLDFVEFRGVFWQPFDGEPVSAGGQGGERAFAGVDRTIVLDQHDRFGLSPGLWSKETVGCVSASLSSP